MRARSPVRGWDSSFIRRVRGVMAAIHLDAHGLYHVAEPLRPTTLTHHIHVFGNRSCRTCGLEPRYLSVPKYNVSSYVVVVEHRVFHETFALAV